MDLQTVTRMCSVCGKDFQALAIITAQIVCPGCVECAAAAELIDWKKEELQFLPDLLNDRLRYAGFRDVELSATLEKVPTSIKKVLPKRDVQALLHGQPLDDAEAFQSFGLTGGQGVGKTMCLAAILRQRTDAQLRVTLNAITVVPDATSKPWHDIVRFRWVNWPDASAWLKTTVTLDKGMATTEDVCRGWIGTPLLVLDDLGRERMARGAYDEDFANGILDRVLDARSRARKATLWTSNLSPASVAKRYGAALTSRLLGLAPVIELAKMPDQRLEPTS